MLSSFFDVNLFSSNGRCIDQFFIRGGHDNLDIPYLSQSFFVLQKDLYEIILTKTFCLIKHL